MCVFLPVEVCAHRDQKQLPASCAGSCWLSEGDQRLVLVAAAEQATQLAEDAARIGAAAQQAFQAFDHAGQVAIGEAQDRARAGAGREYFNPAPSLSA